MVAGRIEPTAFRETLGSILSLAVEGGRAVRVYSEMKAVLFDDGEAISALALEGFWNGLAKSREFLLLCGYPMDAFDDEASAPAFRRVCDQHTEVIPAEGYSLVEGPGARSRVVALLQQQVAALRAELHGLRLELGQTSGPREEAGVERDQAGAERDQAGVERDRSAEQRDRDAEERDEAAERSAPPEGGGSARGLLERLALARRDAASDRRQSSQDRRAGASERTEAELDRDMALADRGASARERGGSSLDDLTGAQVRGAGFVELAREIESAGRSGQALAVAFVDVDHLKLVNDEHGHAAGDRMLARVVSTLRGRLRAHDLIFRYGGDEFVCAIAGLSVSGAAKRLSAVNASLAEGPDGGSVTMGFAGLRRGDSPEDLIARADVELYRRRQEQRAVHA